MIAEQLLTASGELRPEFTASQQQNSQSAQTYLSQQWVIQKRAAALYPGWEIRTKILSLIPDPQGWLAAAHCQQELDPQRGCFWVRYRRQDVPGSPSELDHQQLPAEQLEEIFADTLPAVLATEQLLRDAPVDRRLFTKLYRQESSKVHLVRNCPAIRLREILLALGVKITADLPPSGSLVLSHGDALLKNIIATEHGYRLIDWEVLGIYPAELTLVHALTWVIIRMPPERWGDFLQRHVDPCRPLTSLNREQLQIAIYWQLLAEALFWTSSDRQFTQRLAVAKRWLHETA